MFSKSVIASMLASTVAAQSAFGLISIRSGTDLQARTIVASEGTLWIGKETSSYCPLETGCPAGTDTTFLAGGGTKTVSMNVAVPGGQQLYIASTYEVAYTSAHSDDTHGGKATGWEYTEAGDNTVGSLAYPGYGFIACASTDAGVYQLFATPGGEGTGNCTSIALATVASADGTSPSAYQYA